MDKRFCVVLALENAEKNERVQKALQGHYEVKLAKDADEVYALIHQFQPDLAILDYNLTRINPIELHEGIEFLHPTTKFVICVTDENLEVAKRVWFQRSIDYIRKPVGDKHFIDDINKLVRHIVDQRQIHTLQDEVRRLNEENEKLRKLI
jgi:DNA-binding NtrC family response regulator